MELVISVDPCTYHDEQWYHAKVGIPGVWVQDGYGRKPERAVAFALQKLARNLLDGYATISVPDLPENVTREVMDVTWEKE